MVTQIMSSQHKRFWPSLLDRLLAEENEGRVDHFIDTRTLHKTVEENLETLLNTTDLRSVLEVKSTMDKTTTLDAFDNVSASVVNYGVPDMIGRVVSGIHAWELQQGLAEAVSNFEPRISHETDQKKLVEVVVSEQQPRSKQDSRIEIGADSDLTLNIAGRVHGTPEYEVLQISTHVNELAGNTDVTIE